MKKFLFLILSLLMLLSSCTDSAETSSAASENTSDTSSQPEESVVDQALALVNDSKIKEAYTLLYNNRNNEEAKEMLSDFTVVYSDAFSKGYRTYNAYRENTYNEYGDPIKENIHSIYEGFVYEDGYVYEYTYNELGKKLICKRYDSDDGENAIVTNYSYDENGNLLREEEIRNYEDDNGNDVVYIEYLDYTYDVDGNLLSEILSDADGAIYSYIYAYDENGNMIKKDYYNTETNYDNITYVYNDQNQLVQEINEKRWGKEIKNYTLNDRGDIVTTVVSYEYNDDKNKPVSHEYTYEYEYDENGNKIKYVRNYPNGETVTEEYSYDERENIVKKSIVSSEGNAQTYETVFEYFDDGSIKKESITSNEWSESRAKYEYDDHGNCIRMYFNDVEHLFEYTYDENGRIATELKKLHDEKPVKLEYTYDEKGNVTKVISYNPENPDNKDITEYSYDAEGNITIEHNYIGNDDTESEHHLYQYTYDTNGNLIKEVKDYYGGDYVYTTEYSYDKYNNPLTFFEYDEDGDTRENKTYSYEYDEKGNTIKETVNDLHHNTVSSFTREYDENGNCTKSTLLKEDGSVYSVTATVYDSDGRILDRTVTYPDSERCDNVWNYTYDELGNLISEFTQAATYGGTSIYEYSNYLYFYTPNK